MSTHGYRVWLPDNNKIIETISVRFGNEAISPKDMRKHQEQDPSYAIGTNSFSTTEQHNSGYLGPTYILHSDPPKIDPL